MLREDHGGTGDPTTRDHELRTRPYEPGDEATVVAMYGEVFGQDRSAEEVARRLEQGPGGPARRQVLVEDDEVIGHTALLPMPAWVEGTAADVAIGCDSMVRPDWQGQGRFEVLALSLFGEPTSADFGIAFTTERPLGAFERLSRSRSQGRLRQWVRWHDVDSLEHSAGRSLPRMARPLAYSVLKVVGRLSRLPGAGVKVEPGRPSDDELDELAAASASFASKIHVRDAAYLRWRWDPRQWAMRHARSREGELLGWVVSGRDPRRSAGTGVISDLLCRTPRAATALVQHAAEALAADGAGVVTCAYQDPRRWSGPAMVAAGFVPRGVAPPVLSFALTPRGEGSLDLAGWYLTTGELV